MITGDACPTNLLIARETQVLRDIYEDAGQDAFDKAAVEYLAKIAALIDNVDGTQRLHAALDELKAAYPLTRDYPWKRQRSNRA